MVIIDAGALSILSLNIFFEKTVVGVEIRFEGEDIFDLNFTWSETVITLVNIGVHRKVKD